MTRAVMPRERVASVRPTGVAITDPAVVHRLYRASQLDLRFATTHGRLRRVLRTCGRFEALAVLLAISPVAWPGLTGWFRGVHVFFLSHARPQPPHVLLDS